MSASYPYFNGIQFGLCSLSAGTEIKISPNVSLVPSVNIYNESFSGEIRRYLQKDDNSSRGFISARLSSRKNIGIGFGMTSTKNHELFAVPSFGMCYNITNECFKPFISLRFYL